MNPFGMLSRGPAPVVMHPVTGAPVPVATRRAGRFATGTAAAALLCSTIGGFEGLRQTAYPDPATRGEPWTVCYGHTGADVTPGVRKSLAECKALLVADSNKEWATIQKCIHVPIGDSRAISFVSLAYNIGGGGFCRSSIVRDLNAGRDQQACDDLLKYDRAAGMVMPGLTRRRQAERRLCLENL